MLQAAPAIGAVAAVSEGHDRCAVSHLDARHLSANRDDLTGELMTEDLGVLRPRQRMRLDRSDDRPGDILVEVRAANPTGGDLQHDLPGSWVRRRGHFLDPEIPRSVKSKCLHGTIRSARSRSKRSVNDD
jgi:hypothetical protein